VRTELDRAQKCRKAKRKWREGGVWALDIVFVSRLTWDRTWTSTLVGQRPKPPPEWVSGTGGEQGGGGGGGRRAEALAGHCGWHAKQAN